MQQEWSLRMVLIIIRRRTLSAVLKVSPFSMEYSISLFRFEDMCIVTTESLQEKQRFPLEPNVFEQTMDMLCQRVRDRIEGDLMTSCADIFLEYKWAWKQYIPKRPVESVDLVERFFICINNLLSMFIRKVVVKSMKYFLNYIHQYKVRTIRIKRIY